MALLSDSPVSFYVSPFSASSDPPRLRWTRTSASIFSFILLAVLLAPILQNGAAAPVDDFPLSYYPMFTKPRGPTTRVHHAVAVMSTGLSVNIPGRYAGPGGMNTQRRQMRKAVRKGKADKLAAQVAAALRNSRLEHELRPVRIDIVISTYDISEYFHGRTEPVERVVKASVPMRARAAR